MTTATQKSAGLAAGAALLTGLVFLAGAAHAVPGGNGWQNATTYAVPAGTPQLFYHIDCPTGYSAQNGGFIVAGTQATFGNGFAVTGDGPRLDTQPPYYGQWAWEFQWPAGGAPDGSLITFNVLCKRGAA